MLASIASFPILMFHKVVQRHV